MSGQQHIKQTLQNALLHNKTTHAYLFSGPRGTGKTSAAKIFAKALNCEKGPSDDPCNECATCLSITKGANTDVIEFDAASNSRVEEMREIIEKVRYAPSNAKYKVYIIDEVHMLSNSAFNALLKTLEEPPAHVVFILATTEAHKLPLTIISRCQRFDFKPLTSFDIINRMKTILADANIQSQEEALKVIAQAASGGMRDALSMLDQVVSFGDGKNITLEDSLLVTGSIGEDVFYQLAEALADKDAGVALSLLNSLIADGKDVTRLAEDFITFFRDLLLIKTAPQLQSLLELISSEERFEQLAQQHSIQTLYAYIDILAKTQQEMRFSNHAKVYIESAMLKMIHLESAVTNSAIDKEVMVKIQQLESQVQSLEQQFKKGTPSIEAQPVQATRKPISKNTQTFRIPTGKINEVLKEATKKDLTLIRESWPQMMQSLQKSDAALLENATPVAASNNAFILNFKFEIHCIMASEKATLRHELSNVTQLQTGKKVEVIFIPDDSWQKARKDFIEANKLGQSSHVQEGKEKLEQELTESVLDLVEDVANENADPLVEEAVKLFGEDLIEVYDN